MNYHYTIDAVDPGLALIATLLPLMLLVLAAIVMGTLTHKLATKKGYQGYFWTGFFLWVVGLIYVVGLPNKTE